MPGPEVGMRNIPLWWIKTYVFVVLISVLAGVTGFIRDALITGRFGASLITDAYFVALLIPDALVCIFGNSLTTHFVPLYYEAEKANRVQRFASSIITLYLLAAGSIVLFAYWQTELLVSFFSAGFSKQAVQLTGSFLRVFLVNALLITAAGYCQAFLQARHRFLLPSAAGVLYNLTVISGVCLLAGLTPFAALSIGTVGGYLIQLLVQIPQTAGQGSPFPALRPAFTPEVKKFLLLSIPVAVLAVLKKLMVAVENYYATRLGEGGVTALNLGFQAMMLIYSSIITSTIWLAYPPLSRSAISKDNRQTGAILQKVIDLLLIVLVPIAVYCVVNSRMLIDSMYLRGAFTAKQSLLTAMIFRGYAAGLFCYALRDLLVRYFFSEYNIPVLLVNGFADAGLNCVLLWLLVPIVGLPGISLAAALSVGASCLLLLVWGGRRTPVLRRLIFSRLAVRTLAASLPAVLITFVCRPFLAGWFSRGSASGQMIRLGSEFAVFGLVYCALLLVYYYLSPRA